MAKDDTTASGKPIAQPNPDLLQVVQNGEKPTEHRGKPDLTPTKVTKDK